MGKNQKLKEQRKIDRVRKQLTKEKKLKLSGLVFVGIILGIIVGTGVYFGTLGLKNWFGSNNNNKTKQVDSSKLKTYKKGEHVYTQAPDMQIDTSKTYVAKFETIDGNFDVTLNAKDAPKTTNNFVVLAKDGFYDGLTFHRIVKDFMIQGGDPDGTGSGGPGYKFDDEKFSGDYTVGTIAMANSGKNTNGSQFFIMTGDYSGGKLPKDYIIFGKVTSGLDVVTKIGATETKAGSGGENSTPVSKVTINKVTIEEK